MHSPKTPASGAGRLAGLELLRAAAVVWVMLYHVTSYGPKLPGFIEYGYMAVDVFFVLSGFLVGGQLLRPYAGRQSPRWAQFFVRRAFRILPAYLVVLALYFSFPTIRESEDIQPLWQFLTFTQNIFADYARARAFSHAWSLCIEEHFYLLLPALVWLSARRPSAARAAGLAVALLLAGMVLRGWLWRHEVAPFQHITNGEENFFDRYVEQIYNPTYARLDGLLAGVSLAAVELFRPAWWAWAMARRQWFLAAGLLTVYGAMSLESPGYLSAVVGFPLLSAGLAAIVLASASPSHWAGRWRVPGATLIAAMGFSLYLTHKAVIHLVHDYFGGQLQGSNLLALCVYGAAAMAVGAMLYFGVERPAMRLRARILDQPKAPHRRERPT